MSVKEVETYEYQIMQLRRKLDELDQEIVDALRVRFNITDQIGALKKNFDKPVYDSNREQEIVQKIKEMCFNDSIKIDESKIEIKNTVDYSVENMIDNMIEIYKTIMEQSRKRQSEQ